jgi:hypothetical protein
MKITLALLSLAALSACAPTSVPPVDSPTRYTQAIRTYTMSGSAAGPCSPFGAVSRMCVGFH